jgi:hypothetical protein
MPFLSPGDTRITPTTRDPPEIHRPTNPLHLVPHQVQLRRRAVGSAVHVPLALRTNPLHLVPHQVQLRRRAAGSAVHVPLALRTGKRRK